jgi:hypothetical protein
MMDVRKHAWIGILAAMMLVGLAGTAEAFYIDDKNTLAFGAKLSTRASFRMQDADGFTQPDVQLGDLVQWRNLALLEVDHDLKELTKSLDILYPLKKWKIRSKYHIVGRFMYEALYNVGSDKFKMVRDNDPVNIDNFKQAYDLWECYLDLSRGPGFIRIGRQILAWGETDIFRLLDNINPLDNTFGGPFEDLDDRRIPLWMLRGSYNLGSVGPIGSMSIEGFWVPGSVDARVGPWAPWGTPYEVPLDKASVYDIAYVNSPDKKMSNSRWGVRLQGMIGSTMNVGVAYMETFGDTPTSHIILTEPVVGPLLDTSLAQIHLDYPKFQIVGGSMNFWESMTDTVFRAEVAYFIKEPVNIHGISDRPLTGPVIPLSWNALDILAVATGTDLRSTGVYGIPFSPQSGPIPVKNSLNWMIGFDKQIWMRALNKKSMFFTSFQYFGKWYPDWDKDQYLAVPKGDLYLAEPNSITGEPIPDLSQYPSIESVSSIFTGLISTNYMNGALNPQLAIAYDVRGVWLFLPSVMYIKEPFRVSLQYGGIVGNYTGFGVFRDRDQISVNFTYMLN